MNHAEQIRKLEARLKETKAKAARQSRKDRTGQLVSLGILFERNMGSFSPKEKADWIHRASELDERNRSRVHAAFLRVTPMSAADTAKPKEESEEIPAGKSDPLV